MRRRALFFVRVGIVLACTAAIVVVTADNDQPGRAAPRVESAKPAQPATSPAPPATTVTIAAAGDIVMGSTPNLPPNGPSTFFSAVAPELDAEVVIGNLEGTLTNSGASKCGAGSSNCFAFRTPPTYAPWLRRAGFTVMNLANNHAYDYGPRGQRDTVLALDRAGLLTTGRPTEVAVQQTSATSVAILGFASYDWAQSLTDLRAAKRLVRRATQQADIVAVMFHGGAEGADRQHVPRGTETFLGENRGNLRAFAHAVVDAGADLVVGSGPHVLRGMEWYKGRLVAYSLGNFAGYKVFSLGGPLGISGVLHVTLRNDGSYVRGRLAATELTAEGYPTLDDTERAHGPVRSLSREDFGKNGVAVTASGALRR
jgi:poly-gamma-glutamate capsule biosynthesis protein CapA/YwtB (metallophosphatase superfamily)